MADRTTTGASAEAVRRLVPGYDGAGVERQVSTDQSNLSIAVDERVLVKWLREPAAPGDFATLERLRDRGFTHMPRFIGRLVEDGRVVAVANELVAGATDGWQWYVDDVLGWIDGTRPRGSLIETAASMGRITADLHDALAPALPSTGSLAGTRARVDALAALAFELPDPLLRSHRREIEDALALLDATETAVLQPIHGDLHAGQFLRAGDDGPLLLTDFDDDPMTGPEDRLRVQPVERDVASLVQSLDHVARVAAKRRPGTDVEPFVAAAIDACLAAYRASHVLDGELLWPLRVAQELHEYVYAATRLPVWSYVPQAALVRMFPG
jgi:predicted trehalose synthase